MENYLPLGVISHPSWQIVGQWGLILSVLAPQITRQWARLGKIKSKTLVLKCIDDDIAM